MNRAIKDERCIPKDAVAVRVTSVINPSLIRIYETNNHALRASKIRKKLEIYAKQNLNFEEDVNERINLNDSLIVMTDTGSDIPTSICRGILGQMNEDQTKYNVFLPDYGIAFDLTARDFRKVPEDAIPDKYLTETIQLNDIIPASVNKNNKLKGKTILTIVEEWTESATCMTKELIGAAKRIYFHPTGCDENEKLYGELYLDIEEEIVILSQALIYSFFAVKLQKTLLKHIYEPGSAEKGVIKKINGGLLIDQANFDDDSKSKVKHGNLDDSSTGTEEDNTQDSDSVDMEEKRKNMYRKHDREFLIRSQHTCQFLDSIKDARYPENIHKALRNQNINGPMKIQSYMWPSIAKGLDVIAISHARAGKTYGYLLPIASYLATHKIATGRTPTTLVLCSSSSKVATVTALFEEFLHNYSHIKIVSAVNGKPEKTIFAHIVNGCQVLVSTAPFLARFLKKYRRNEVLNLNLNRLRHIILDGGDIILDKYMESIMEIFLKHEVMREKHDLRDNDLSLQVIAVGQQWTQGLSYFMDNFTVYPYVCIGSYLEAAAFSRVQAKLYLLKMEEKGEKILEIVNEFVKSDIEKTMIICSNETEAIDLNKLLQSNDKETLLAHGDMIFDKIHDIKYQWEHTVSGKYPILISTENVLSDLDIKDAKCLIHYSINSATKSRFYYRFSTMRAHWQMALSKCKVFIMVDRSNNKQFNGLMEVMKRLHASLPKDWIEAAKSIALNLDKEKRAYPICVNVKAMGFCPKSTNCSFRHCVLNPEDAPKLGVEIGDKVELMITYLHNASHFSGRLLKCYKANQKEPFTYPADEMQRNEEIQKFYKVVENRRALKTVNVGDICAMEDTVDNYMRVKVLGIVSRDDLDEPTVVTIKFIDYPFDLIRVKTCQLLYIPKKLQQWQTRNVDIFLTNLEAYDKEYEWDQCSYDAVADWFRKNFTSNCTVIAKVNLCLENTFWVNTLEIRAKIAGYPEITVSSLRNYLIEKNHAIENKEHLTQLFQLCKNGGLNDLRHEEDFNVHEQVD